MDILYIFIYNSAGIGDGPPFLLPHSNTALSWDIFSSESTVFISLPPRRLMWSTCYYKTYEELVDVVTRKSVKT